MGAITVIPGDFIGQYKLAKSITDTAIIQPFITREFTRTLYRLLGKELADLLIAYNNLIPVTTISGSLVVGVSYKINTLAPGDDFINVGASSNEAGIYFLATGTTPTVWTNGSSLTSNKVERYENLINPFYMESITCMVGSPYYDSTGIKDLLLIQIYSAYLSENQVRDSQMGVVGQKSENGVVQSPSQAYRMGEQKWNTTGLATWNAIRWYCRTKYPEAYPEYAGVMEHARMAGILG